MRKLLALILSMSLAVPAFGQEGGGCADTGGSFESIAGDFVAGWRGDSGFCEFKKVTELNEMIAEDMLRDPDRYNRRMHFLLSLRSKNEDAVNYLRYSFQETWFNVNIDAILLREQSRSGNYSRWLMIGAAGTAVALLAVPFTKKHSSKLIRVIKTGLKHFFQKRALTFAPTSIGTQADRIIGDPNKKSADVLVAPPLYFGGDEEILDERTYDVFLNELKEDIYSAGAGILGGWGLGHGASVLVRDKVAKSWADTALGRFAFARSKPATFASPGLIVGFAVTLGATNAISDYTSNAFFASKFKSVKKGIDTDLRELRAAVSNRQDFQVYSLAERLKNDLTLHNFILAGALTDDVNSEIERRQGSLLNSFRYCYIPRAALIEQSRVGFEKDIAALVKRHKRNVQAALSLSADAQETLLAHPHRLTKSLTGLNDKLLQRTGWMLDAKQVAADLWPDVVNKVKDLEVECIDPSRDMPL